MLEKLIAYLGNEKFYTKVTKGGNIEVRAIYDNSIDQEIYYSLEQGLNKEFNIYKVSRGISRLIINFINEDLAFFYLGVLSKNSIKNYLKPNPKELNDIDEIANLNLEEALKVIKKYIPLNYYSVFQSKKKAICLVKKLNSFIVCFVDFKGQERIISDDNDELGTGILILCNYAWLYMWLEELSNEWSPIMDKESFEYLKLQGHFLNAK